MNPGSPSPIDRSEESFWSAVARYRFGASALKNPMLSSRSCHDR